MKSQHTFQVPVNSVMRLFMDTHNSGLKVKFRILDDLMRVVSESNIVDEEERTEVLFKVIRQSSTFKQD